MSTQSLPLFWKADDGRIFPARNRRWWWKAIRYVSFVLAADTVAA
jgi:hypothetical protein